MPCIDNCFWSSPSSSNGDVMMCFFCCCCKVNKPAIKRICPSEEMSSKRQRVSHVNKNNNIVMKESVKKSSVVERLSKTNLNDSNKLSTPVKKEDAESSLSGNLGERKSRDYIR